MNINELDKFQLSKAIDFHEDLNPQLFVNGKMRPEVRNKLMEIADHFREFLGVEHLALVDITISGSNAAYSYTPHSDIDLHLVVDFSRLPESDIYRELFDAKKFQFNEQHDIKIKGYDVELYVQDAAQAHSSLGEYSILKDEWKRIPSKRRANLDDTATRLKYEKLRELAIMALASNSESYLDKVLDIIRRYRKAGLSEKGEFGPENLAFKMIRTEGLFQKLWAKKRELTSRDLSLEAGKAHLDYNDEVLQGNIQTELEGRQLPEDLIKEMFKVRPSLFDDFDYGYIHDAASGIAEASYEGNIGAMEMMKFYQIAPKNYIDLLKRLIAANKKKEAWQLVQKVVGSKLQGKEFQMEGVGKIVKGVNTTDDVGVNQTKIEAAKLGLKVSKDGVPPTLKTNGKK